MQTNLDLSKIKINLRSKVQTTRPDSTLYKEIKKISLVNLPVKDIRPTNMPLPKSLYISDKYLEESWYKHHGALIEMTYKGFTDNTTIPLRSIFPGPYIPWLEGKMDIIGDTSFSIFVKILKTIKQRVPKLKHLVKKADGYIYENTYSPIIMTIRQPEEGWFLEKIKCPAIEGVYFPLSKSYEMNKNDLINVDKVIGLVKKNCDYFCKNYVGVGKKRTLRKIKEILSLIRSFEYLYTPEISLQEIEAANEIFSYFDKLNISTNNSAEFVFEVDHVVSYLTKLQKKEIILSGIYGMFWIDAFKLKIEDLIETELGDINRVLKEIKQFFSVGWAPILVHISNNHGFNTDGTHRHYALLTIELLRRLKNTFKQSLRKIDLRSEHATRIIFEFTKRYNKHGLSLRESVRTVNYLISSEEAWPFLEFLELNLKEIRNREFKWVAAVYLPEWRARVVVKSLCDKGIALVGIPPINIEIVGQSNGKKGIFIRGGYHGDDRQPNVWLDMVSLQN